MKVEPEQIAARDHDKCQRCGRRGHDAHHRKTKARGGPDAWENLIYLCRACHSWAHADQDGEATDAGYLIASWEPDEWITTIPVFYFDRNARVLLGPDGSVNEQEVKT